MVLGVEETALLFRACSLGDIARITFTAPQILLEELTEIGNINVGFANIQLFTDETLCRCTCYHTDRDTTFESDLRVIKE